MLIQKLSTRLKGSTTSVNLSTAAQFRYATFGDYLLRCVHTFLSFNQSLFDSSNAISTYTVFSLVDVKK